jgi:aspartate 1-decarboxylase
MSFIIVGQKKNRPQITTTHGTQTTFVILKGTEIMLRTMCKGKIHRATITQADLSYVGSITIDQDLLDAANIYPYEKVQVVNINNGSRLETYTIAGARGSGVICLNGAAARLNAPGDLVIIISYAQYDENEIRTLTPHIVFVDAENHLTEAKQVPLAEMLPESAFEAIA